MKGEWVYEEKLDRWHLEWGYAENPELIHTWCGLEFPADTRGKHGDQIDGFADVVHDECVRKSEELP